MLAAGAAGKRAVLPHARVVLHQPAGRGRGAIPDLILQADELVRVRGEVEEILARHSGQDAAKLRTDTDRDRVFTAPDAVAYGLADRVLAQRPEPGEPGQTLPAHGS
jgi:ATP-dependent Clp protease protease subunit